MSLVIDPTSGHYCRSTSTKRQELSSALARYYNVNPSDVQIMLSGMTAISVMMSFVKGTVLLSNELYCDTERTVLYHKLKYDEVDVTDSNEVLRLISSAPFDLFFLESCSNPSGKVLDWSIIPKIKSIAPKCIICVDNTWTSACSFNPFDVGADVVIESMTKYISGSSCIGGVLLSQNKEIMDHALSWNKINGQFIGADHCEIFMQGLVTIEERMTNTSKSSQTICDFLRQFDNVTVVYPGAQNHVSFDIYRKYFKMKPGCIWIHMKGKNFTRRKLIKLFEAAHPIKFETSYGASYSKIDPWFKHTTDGVWFRLSIGFKSTCDELQHCLENIIKTSQS